MELTGRCFCGAIRWEANVDENFVGICHCRDCQVFGGGAFRTVGVADVSQFRFSSGTPRQYAKVGDSGSRRVMQFCGECGTHLCSLPDAAEGFVSIRVATSDQFAGLRPSLEIYCDSRVPWLQPVEGAQQFPAMPG